MKILIALLLTISGVHGNISDEVVTINAVYDNMQTKDLLMAKYTYDAGIEYGIDPLLLTALINSESGYDYNVKHKISAVKGMAGIHTKYWKIPNNTRKEQIYAGAYVLSQYIEQYDGNLVKALTGYKGVSDVGRSRAKYVYECYRKMKEERNV